jgi:hypothetical protein
MRTVPYHLAELAVGDLIAGYGVKIGRSVEIDLDALRRDHPHAATQVASYAEQADDLTGDYLAVAVPLVTVRQTDNAAGRSDLVAELEALEASELSDVVVAALSREPDAETIATLGAPHRVSYETVGDDRTRIVLTVAGHRPWSTHLGGAPTSREVARRFTLTTSHAAWRDRRSRRLLTLDVHAIELVPDPAAADSRHVA